MKLVTLADVRTLIRHVPAERRERTTWRYVSSQLAEAAAGAIDSRVDWPVLLALSTGMRRGEVLAVRWKNVDLERGTLRVMESLEQTQGFGSSRRRAVATVSSPCPPTPSKICAG
jgi:integrase